MFNVLWADVNLINKGRSSGTGQAPDENILFKVTHIDTRCP
jgi:hypothetical protein